MSDEDRIPSDEGAPLLGSRPRLSHRRLTSAVSIRNIHIPKAHSKTTIVNLLSLVILLACTATGFLQLPQAQIIEDVICHEYYDKLKSLDTPIDEELCKVESISAELAFVLAITSTLSAVVGLVTTFPWSVVADRIGRKPVLSLSLVGLTLGTLWTTTVLWFRTIFPIRLVWLECVGQVIGGGIAITMSLLFSMVADSTNEDERAVMFVRLHVASLAGNMLSPSISSLLMAHYGPWPSMLIGIGFLASSAVVVLFVPETLQVKSSEPASGSEDCADQTSRLPQMLARLKDSVAFIRSPSLVCLLITCLVGMPVAFSTNTFMPVFMSKRYGIKLLQGGYVQSAFGIVQMVVLFAVVPLVSRALMRSTGKFRPVDEHHRDIIIARWSAGVSLFAAVAMGVAPTLSAFLFGLVLLALGSALFSFINSLMSLYVDPKHRSRLFGLVGMVQILGQIYAQPMLAELFALGMKLGGEWIGLPYFGLALLLALVTGLLLFVRVSPKMKRADSLEEAHI
ncbi:unnamed protein product [Discula destructiva]